MQGISPSDLNMIMVDQLMRTGMTTVLQSLFFWSVPAVFALVVVWFVKR